jgi:hypothetical protein
LKGRRDAGAGAGLRVARRQGSQSAWRAGSFLCGLLRSCQGSSSGSLVCHEQWLSILSEAAQRDVSREAVRRVSSRRPLIHAGEAAQQPGPAAAHFVTEPSSPDDGSCPEVEELSLPGAGAGAAEAASCSGRRDRCRAGPAAPPSGRRCKGDASSKLGIRCNCLARWGWRHGSCRSVASLAAELRRPSTRTCPPNIAPPCARASFGPVRASLQFGVDSVLLGVASGGMDAWGAGSLPLQDTAGVAPPGPAPRSRAQASHTQQPDGARRTWSTVTGPGRGRSGPSSTRWARWARWAPGDPCSCTLFAHRQAAARSLGAPDTPGRRFP